MEVDFSQNSLHPIVALLKHRQLLSWVSFKRGQEKVRERSGWMDLFV